jgi:hypothetical protein
MMVQNSSIQINITRGLTHRDFHIITGTRNFSSHCCIIRYSIHTARNPHHHENISAEIAAGNHQRNGQTYGIISNNPANRASVHFCGMLIPNNSSIHNQMYDIIQINKHRKI